MNGDGEYWCQIGPDAWRSTDYRLQIDRSVLRETPRRIEAYEISVDGRDTGCASLTLPSAQSRALRLLREAGRLERREPRT